MRRREDECHMYIYCFNIVQALAAYTCTLLQSELSLLGREGL